MLIAEPRDFSPAAREILETVGSVELRACDPSALARAFADYDVVWFRLAYRVDAKLIGDRPRCRFLATPVTGLDHIDLAACAAKGVTVLSLRGETEFLTTVRATAELTIGLALAVLRNIPAAAAAARAGVWDRDRFRGRELFGRTAGIVGVGRLGKLVAGYLRAFGMRVIGYDPREDFPHAAAERKDSLQGLLAEADLVVVLVKYDDSTRRLFGAQEFSRMRPGAVFVNAFARGRRR